MGSGLGLWFEGEGANLPIWIPLKTTLCAGRLTPAARVAVAQSTSSCLCR